MKRILQPLLLLAVLISACNPPALVTPGAAVTATASPAPINVTTARPTSTATLAPSARYFQQDFDFGVIGWKTIITSGEPGLLDLRVQDGAWVFDLGGTDLHSFALFQNEIYKNVRVDVRAINRGDTAYSLSLICRYNEEEGWYQYNIFNSGIYNLYYYKWDDDQQLVPTLLAEGVSHNVERGQTANEIGIACDGRDLTLYVNGQVARTFPENLYILRDGWIGVGVSSFDRLPIQLDIDWLRISLP